MENRKLNIADVANILMMRAVGYSNLEIANSLDVTPATVTYHVKRIRERSEEVGPSIAFMEVMMKAAPVYPVFNIINQLNNLQKKERGE